MVGSASGAPGFNIHFDLLALRRKRPGRKDVVEAPALVAVERAGAQVIPEGELLAVWVEVAKDVDEAPGNGFLVRLSDAFMKADVPEMFFRAVHVDRFGCDVHVAAPQRRKLRRQM